MEFAHLWLSCLKTLLAPIFDIARLRRFSIDSRCHPILSLVAHERVNMNWSDPGLTSYCKCILAIGQSWAKSSGRTGSID